jgi:hypothetical protein
MGSGANAALQRANPSNDRRSAEFNMFLGDSIVFWLFGICFAAGIGTTLTLWECIRKQVNRVLPEGKRFASHPPFARSVTDFLFGTGAYGYYAELLEQHRKYYPRSVLRKSVVFAMVSVFPSFIGYVISAR